MRRIVPIAAATGLSAGLLAVVPGALGVASGAAPATPVVVADPAASCDALTGVEVPAASIGLPTQGALVASATLTAASGSRPEHCQVRGSVRPNDPSAPDIVFQVNLPTAWNLGSVQLGGGGFNGVVIDGLGNVPGTAGSAAPTRPLDRGYVTFGSDSGNAVGSDPAGSFALNRESLENYSGDSIKRTRDAVMSLVDTYYGELPTTQIFAGASKGGHEALIAAQEYGDDYDGIIAYYPANQNQAMDIAWYHMAQQWNRPGGSLDAAEIALVQDAVMSTCDKLDGAVDGVIANTSGCDDAFKVADLRCPSGADAGDACLSQTQIGTLRAATSPFKFAFTLANGVTEMQAFPYFHGASAQGITSYGRFTEPVIKYFITQDPDASTDDFDYRRYEPRVKELSTLLDATDPDIDEFVTGGGKILMVQGTTDTLVTAGTTSAYYESLERRYGDDLGEFARYYVQPGYAHGNGAFNLSWDSLTALENWVHDGLAPVDQVATDGASATAGRTMPLCDYPAWPRRIAGPADEASSFACVDTTSVDATTTALAVSANTQAYGAAKPVRATATVTGLDAGASGSVRFVRGSTVLGTAALTKDGTAALALPSTTPVGAHLLKAVFIPAADAVAAGSTSTGVRVQVRKAKATVTATVAQRAKVVVRVKAGSVKPTGRVTVTVVGQGKARVVSAKLTRSRIVVTLPRLPRGTYKVSVAYQGSATVGSAKAAVRTLRVR
ncbi:tannase/feruloyl esterase family alpha/beta hydrolase [Nocardioides dubius]|uniref:Bacterial Ig-like domain-containing protein n=1 Tax=Nocardioides dubius TaxID=317019 RepID=A0ABN1TU76_9ACTN